MPETVSNQNEQKYTVVRKFLSLQTARVEAYNTLNKSFKDYLKTSPEYNFDSYKQTVHQVTERFNDISTQIMEIINFLKSQKDCEHIVKCMEIVQESEAEKLVLTRDLQIQQKSVNDNAEGQDELEELQERMQIINEKITTVLDDFKYEAEDILTS